MNSIQFGIAADSLTIRATTPTDDLTDKEGYLVKVTDSTGSRVGVDLLDDPADIPIGVVENGAAAGADVDVRLLKPGDVLRIRNGASAIVRGDEVLSNTGGTVLPRTGAGADDYRIVGIALEDCPANGTVLVCALNQPITVT